MLGRFVFWVISDNCVRYEFFFFFGSSRFFVLAFFIAIRSFVSFSFEELAFFLLGIYFKVVWVCDCYFRKKGN